MVRLITNAWNKVVLAYNGTAIENIAEFEDKWIVVFASVVGVCEDGGGPADIIIMHGEFEDGRLEEKFRKACEEVLELERRALVDTRVVKDGTFYIFDDLAGEGAIREVTTSFDLQSEEENDDDDDAALQVSQYPLLDIYYED